MCGIVGVVSKHDAASLHEPVIVAMRDSLAHRGPDDAGLYFGPGVALGSRRLSILDLSPNGRMPMATADGRYWIAYNGEAYNFEELRRGLQAKGHRFRSSTDTEVLLYLYADRGPEMLGLLNGMFAIAVWDATERTLFLARDRVGVKPLYYHHSHKSGTLRFASEEKALFAAGIQPEFDTSTWEELLCFRHVAGDRTPFREVRRLLPGHYLLWKDGRFEVRRWWDLAARTLELRDQPPKRDVVGWFRETFDDAVRLRRISDVPVGVLLSGGLDSSSVAASLRTAAGQERVASFTVRFPESGFDEGPLAHEVASRWSLEAHDLFVQPSDLLARLRRAAWLNDEPSAHGNDVHMWAISEYAKPHVSVLLSGEGADETLGGYVRYQPLRYARLLTTASPLVSALASACQPGRVKKLAKFLSLEGVDRFVMFNSCNTLPSDLAEFGLKSASSFPFRERVIESARQLYPGDAIRQAMFNDQHTFLCSLLDRNDRMTMGASIECRVPFLDYRLVEGLAALPSAALLTGFQGKPLLRRASKSRLPSSVLRHRKWGFGVPWGHYFRNNAEFRSMLHDITNLEPVVSGPLDRARIRQATTDYICGDSRCEPLIKQLLSIVIWYEACCQPVSVQGRQSAGAIAS